MNEAALLALISNLYAQLLQAAEENKALAEALAAAHQQEPPTS